MSISSSTPASGPASRSAARRAWIAPALRELPPLEQLTLQTQGIVGDCGTVGGTCMFSLFPTHADDVG